MYLHMLLKNIMHKAIMENKEPLCFEQLKLSANLFTLEFNFIQMHTAPLMAKRVKMSLNYCSIL